MSKRRKVRLATNAMLSFLSMCHVGTQPSSASLFNVSAKLASAAGCHECLSSADQNKSTSSHIQGYDSGTSSFEC